MIKFLLFLVLFGCDVWDEDEFYFIPDPSHYEQVSFERALILNRQGVVIHKYFPYFPHHKIIHYRYDDLVCYYYWRAVPCIGDVFYGAEFNSYIRWRY